MKSKTKQFINSKFKTPATLIHAFFTSLKALSIMGSH